MSRLFILGRCCVAALATALIVLVAIRPGPANSEWPRAGEDVLTRAALTSGSEAPAKALPPAASAETGRSGRPKQTRKPAGSGPRGHEAANPEIAARFESSYGQLPLSFEPNQGQADARVNFLSRGPGYILFLTPREALLNLVGGKQPGSEGRAQAAVRMQLLNADPKARLEGLEPLPGKSNYFVGSDPGNWRTNIANYAKVRQKSIWPGIDLIYYGNPRQLEYDFVVSPGADPEQIRLHFQALNAQDAPAPRLENGDLVLDTDAGGVRFKKPLAYQDIEGVRREIAGDYKLYPDSEDRAGARVGFALAAYDRDRPLVIDPTLVYSTYLGGSAADIGYGITVDSSGKAYVTGTTSSSPFPTTAGAYDTAFGGGQDVFVVRLNAAGTALEYSTYLGGAGTDIAYGIDIDGSGNAYVTGETSGGFPTTDGSGGTISAYNTSFGGGASDAFIAKLNSTGSVLLYSTYVGGSGTDAGRGIAVDASGIAYLTGNTSSPSTGGTAFPTTASAFDATCGTEGTCNAGASDAFVTRINTTLGGAAGLLYSTYLGGNGADVGHAIDVDASGNAYVTGETLSTNFTLTAGALDPICGTDGNCNGGKKDAFVTKINTAASGGASVVFSTYLGGEQADIGYGIAIDGSGNVYVTGETSSLGFPISSPFQGILASAPDAFVTKIGSAGTPYVYSTFLGGTGADSGRAIDVDAGGSAYVTGHTASTNFPVANAFQLDQTANDVFVTRFTSGGNGLSYSTYFGGAAADQAYAIAVDGNCNAYITGDTASSGVPFPLLPTGSVYDDSYNGAGDAFVAKVQLNASEGSCAGGPPGANPTLTLAGSGTGSGTVTATGINCTITAGVTSGDCTEPFTSGSTVALTATAASGSTFGGWSGGSGNCTGSTTPCTTAGLTADTTVTATFSTSDTTPDAFSFISYNAVAVSTTYVSTPVAITGISASANVSVSGGDYCLSSQLGCRCDLRNWTTTAGTVTNNQHACVRHTSSANGGTSVTTTLTVGGVSSEFTTGTVTVSSADTPSVLLLINGVAAGSTTHTQPLAIGWTVANVVNKELYLLYRTPGAGGAWYYVNAAGQVLPAVELSQATPVVASGPSGGTYTLFTNVPVTAGVYEVYLVADNVIDGHLTVTNNLLRGLARHFIATVQ